MTFEDNQRAGLAPSQLTFEQVAHALTQECKWTFAKSMPQWPHFWTLKKDWRPAIPFTEIVAHMRLHGYVERWHGRPFIRFDVNEYKYWTMGAPLADTILINRALTEHGAYYDEIADRYDDLWNTAEARKENHEVFAKLDHKDGESILDIGCGTGLLLDELKQAYDSLKNVRYLGVDPSAKMLDRLHAKYKKAQTVHTPLETFFTTERYDLIVALFGTASYVDPDILSQRVVRYLAPGGRYFLMFYRPGYEPETHKKTGIKVPFHPWRNGVSPPGRATVWHNFMIVEGP